VFQRKKEKKSSSSFYFQNNSSLNSKCSSHSKESGKHFISFQDFIIKILNREAVKIASKEAAKFEPETI